MRLNLSLKLKRSFSTSLSMALVVLMALPAHLQAMDFSAESYDVAFQPSGNRRIIFRDEQGNFLGYSAEGANLEVRVTGDVIRRSVVNGVPDTRRIIEALPNVKDTEGNAYMRMTVQYETITAEGRRIAPGSRILLDMRYFMNDAVQPSGATGTDNIVADEFNDSVIENARLNPPKEPKKDLDPAVPEDDDEEPLEQGTDENSFHLNGYDGRQTFARGLPFPSKFLSAPVCDCPAGCGQPSKFGPRQRPVTSWKRVKRKGKWVRVPRTYGSAFHMGNDIGGRGQTGAKIVAAADGVIKRRRLSSGGYGLELYIDHGNGVETQYAHLRSIEPGMRIGTRVKRGQVIARMGSTGNSSGPHLHFGVWKDGNAINANASMLIDMNSPAAFNKRCSSLPDYPAVDEAMDRALRGALNGSSIRDGRSTRGSTSAN